MPTGDLADGAYDPLGNYYQLPAHIVSNPTNIAADVEDNGAIGEAKADLAVGEEETQDEVDPEQRREEKGKAVVDTRDQVSATIRMSDTSRDLKLDVGKDETVRSIIHRIFQEVGVSSPFLHSNISRPTRTWLLTERVPLQRRPGHHLRLILMGKVLRESNPLMAQGWQPGNVINAFVFELPR